MTFSRVDVAQQLELLDGTFFYLGSTSMRFGRARERGMSSRAMLCIRLHGWILLHAGAPDNQGATCLDGSACGRAQLLGDSAQ